MDDKKIKQDTKKQGTLNQNKFDLGQVEKLKKEAEDYKTKYLRAIADYQNFENRVRENNQQLLLTANSGLVLKLLPFLDSLDKAEIFVKDQGLKIIKDQFHKALQEAGLEEIEVLNKEYDPYTAEVVEICEGEKDNVVVEVLRRGYMFHGKVLRVAQVKVTKKKENIKI